MNTLLYAALLLLPIPMLAFVWSKKPDPRLPPGPKSLPIIGNLLQYPKERAWHTFTNWKREYGDIVYVKVLGQPIVILNSRQACIDLLGKRSAIYSDRPHAVMMQDLVGINWAFSLMPYSARWRLHRRIFHQFFNENASKAYIDIQERCIHSFLLRLLGDPGNLHEHLRLLFSETTLDVVYGIHAKSYKDEFVQTMERFMHKVAEALIPGRFLVDLLPVLKYIPSWFPCADFQRYAITAAQLGENAKEKPAYYALQKAEAKKHSLSKRLLLNG